MKSYHLDPDFRRGNRIGCAALCATPHCIRCQKPFKTNQSLILVTVNWNDWLFIEGHNPNAWPELTDRNIIECGFMGSDCFKKMTKNV